MSSFDDAVRKLEAKRDDEASRKDTDRRAALAALATINQGFRDLATHLHTRDAPVYQPASGRRFGNSSPVGYVLDYSSNNIYNKKTPFKIELLLTQSGKLWRSGKQYVEVTVDDLMGSGFYVGDRNYLKIIGRELVVSGYDDRSSFVDYLAGRAVALVTHNKHLDTFRKI